MRTEVKLQNGTVLRVGDKYLVDKRDQYNDRWFKILCIGNHEVFFTDYQGCESSFPINFINWHPYQEKRKV